MDSGSAPYASHATSYPSQLLSTFAFLGPSSISTLMKMFKKNDPPPLIHVAGLPTKKDMHKKKYFQTLTPELWPNTHMHAYS